MGVVTNASRVGTFGPSRYRGRPARLLSGRNRYSKAKQRKRGRCFVYAPEQCSVRGFPDVSVFYGGRVGASQAERVAHAIGRELDRRGVSGGARVRLKTGNCGGGPMLVQVNLRVGDTPVRVQAVTAGIDDLLPALAGLEHQIDRVAAQWRPRPWPDPTRRMLTVPAGAVITRRKSVALQRATPSEAAAVMDAMDYDAHLFTDAETGEDAVVYRAGPSGLRLARQYHVFPPGWAWSPADAGPPVPLIVNSRPTPTLAEETAVRRACAHGLRMLFFTDPASGRGRLLYPRYDGDLGLIAPTPDGPRLPRHRSWKRG